MHFNFGTPLELPDTAHHGAICKVWSEQGYSSNFDALGSEVSTKLGAQLCPVTVDKEEHPSPSTGKAVRYYPWQDREALPSPKRLELDEEPLDTPNGGTRLS